MSKETETTQENHNCAFSQKEKRSKGIFTSLVVKRHKYNKTRQKWQKWQK